MDSMEPLFTCGEFKKTNYFKWNNNDEIMIYSSIKSLQYTKWQLEHFYNAVQVFIVSFMLEEKLKREIRTILK